MKSLSKTESAEPGLSIMADRSKTKDQLLSELRLVRARVAELEQELHGCCEKVGQSRTRELEEANKQLREEIAERKRVESEKRRLSMAIEQSVNVVFITNAGGVIEYVNPMFTEATGYTSAEAIGRTPDILTSEDGEGPKSGLLWESVFSRGGWQGVLKNVKKDGNDFWCKGVVSPIKDEHDDITHYLAVLEDITAQKLSSEKLRYLSNYDGTTGLRNRAHFIEMMNEWIAEDKDASRTGALFLLDIDQFKFISDAYGHGMGDEFLRRVAKLLQIMLKYVNSRFFNGAGSEKFLCRLSGDEFAIFMPSTGKVEGVEIAEQIRKGIEDFYQADAPCHLTASIGVSLYPEHGRTTTELLTKADAAMYRAKDLGRNRTHFYSPEERDIEKMHSRLKWKENILKALKENRFEPWFQPISSLEDGTIRHYEVLARMRDEEGNIILPGPFIDIAERFGLVGSIAKVIFEKAMLLQAQRGRKGEHLSFCMNISGKELGDKEFLYFLQSKMYETGVDPRGLIFEITETASIHDMDKAMKFVKSLKSMGCRISLDDFGIGFTSFLYLKQMEVDFIKIAGSFIKNLDKNLNDQLFVKAITDVARGMDIKTIAEYVEKDEIARLLKNFGVDFAQGFFIGRPGPYLETA